MQLTVTIWDRFTDWGHWFKGNDYSLTEARVVLGSDKLAIGEDIVINGHIYAIFNKGVNPNLRTQTNYLL